MKGLKKKTGLNKAHSVFGNDSSSDDEGKKRCATDESMKKVSMRQTKIEMERALNEDPTVYDYDEIYDQMEQKKKDTVVAKVQAEKKSKYITKLMKSSENRKVEEERRKERKIQKERQEEGDEFADKEEFVTSSYKKKIEERKAEEERQRLQDKADDANDVTKQKDLGMFYQNLMSNNTAMGADDLEKTENAKKSGKESLEKPKIKKRSKSSSKSEEDKDKESSHQTFKKSTKRSYRKVCLLYTSPSPRDGLLSRMPSSA